MNDSKSNGAVSGAPMSIGRLSQATGLSTERLRIWERRYGRPRPIRLPSGHRRYPREELVRMRQVADLLARGEKAGELLRLGDEELAARIRKHRATQEGFAGLERWMEHLKALRTEELRAVLDRAAAEMRVLDLLEDRLAPFLEEVGTRWADGRLDVRHEHFVAHVVGGLLDELRRRHRAQPGAPRAVLATLVGERHGLGVEMAATIATARGVDATVLGEDTPFEQIVDAVRETNALFVGISVSPFSGGPETERGLKELREILPAHVHVVAGGAGVSDGRRGPRGVRCFRDLRKFDRWLGGLVEKRSAAS